MGAVSQRWVSSLSQTIARQWLQTTIPLSISLTPGSRRVDERTTQGLGLEKKKLKGEVVHKDPCQPAPASSSHHSLTNSPVSPPLFSSLRLSLLLRGSVHHKLAPGERLQQLPAAARRHAQLRQEAPADGGGGAGTPPAAHQGGQLHPAGRGPGQHPGPALLQHALHRHRYDPNG